MKILPLVVVIVNWKSVSYLLPCLRSLVEDNNMNPAAIVVVDNASDDGCGEALARHFPAVRFIPSVANLGFAGANNLGVRHAPKSDWLLFLNPDTVVPRGAIAKALGFLAGAPDIGVAGVRLLNTDGSPQLSSVLLPPGPFSQLLNTAAIVRLRTRRAWRGNKPVRVRAVSGACLMIRRTLLKTIGGWDTRFPIYLEDVDVCTSAEAHGAKVCVLPVDVVHHGGKSTGQHPDAAAWRMRRICAARDIYLRKHRSVLSAYAARLSVFAANALRAVCKPGGGGAGARAAVRWALVR